MTGSEPRSIVFVHPDLGIGGAERLVVDAAVGLQSLGYRVAILTSYCNPSHCFDEARDGTYLNICGSSDDAERSSKTE